MRLFFSLMCCCLSVVSSAEMVDRIVAIVNNEIVTESDLRAFSKKLDQSGMVDDLLLFGQKPQSLKGSKPDQLKYLINERLLESEIKRLNLAVTVEKVEQEIRDIAKRNKVSRAELLDALKGQGIVISDYQDFIKNRIERQSLIEQEVSSKIRVSDEDVLAQYQRSHPASGSGTFEYTLAHILINPKKNGPEKAQERAELAFKKLSSGETFDTVAEQFSEDPNFTTGGLLGTFRAGEFSHELEAAVQNLDVGQTSAIVKSRGGALHILKVLGKKVISDPAFEKEKERVRSELFEVAFQKNFKTWLDMKKEDSFIRINVPDLK
jgi:peptidyl-prolyl cis-trans isomerase SurA